MFAITRGRLTCSGWRGVASGVGRCTSDFQYPAGLSPSIDDRVDRTGSINAVIFRPATPARDPRHSRKGKMRYRGPLSTPRDPLFGPRGGSTRLIHHVTKREDRIGLSLRLQRARFWGRDIPELHLCVDRRGHPTSDLICRDRQQRHPPSGSAPREPVLFTRPPGLPGERQDVAASPHYGSICPLQSKCALTRLRKAARFASASRNLEPAKS